jgi:hypothetical protein
MPTDIKSTHVTSTDGTTLAVDTVGEGAPVILIGGSCNNRSTVAALAAMLAPAFTTITYDRRARGDSDDKSHDYTAQSEIDDLAAVIEYAGGVASVFGHSSGAVLGWRPSCTGYPSTGSRCTRAPTSSTTTGQHLHRTIWSASDGCSMPVTTTGRRRCSSKRTSGCRPKGSP